MALRSALDRLTAGRQDRQDAPDGWVTAARVLPACAAEYAPFPAGVDPQLQEVLRKRGVEQLYTHQAAAIAYALDAPPLVTPPPPPPGPTPPPTPPASNHPF